MGLPWWCCTMPSCHNWHSWSKVVMPVLLHLLDGGAIQYFVLKVAVPINAEFDTRPFSRDDVAFAVKTHCQLSVLHISNPLVGRVNIRSTAAAVVVFSCQNHFSGTQVTQFSNHKGYLLPHAQTSPPGQWCWGPYQRCAWRHLSKSRGIFQLAVMVDAGRAIDYPCHIRRHPHRLPRLWKPLSISQPVLPVP